MTKRYLLLLACSLADTGLVRAPAYRVHVFCPVASVAIHNGS